MAEYTPTVSEYTPTVADTERDDASSVDVEDTLLQESQAMDIGEEEEDTLLNLVVSDGAPVSPPGDAQSLREDSVTSEDSSMHCGVSAEAGHLPAPSPCELAGCKNLDEFERLLRDIDNMLKKPLSCQPQWLCPEFLYENLGKPFDVIAATASEFLIRRAQQLNSSFKVGITENPYDRWFRDNCGYCHDALGYQHMFLLYAAVRSKGPDRATSGNMEKAIIEAVQRSAPLYECCLNTRPGGEGASEGSPHFTYGVFTYAICRTRAKVPG